MVWRTGSSWKATRSFGHDGTGVGQSEPDADDRVTVGLRTRLGAPS